MKSSEITDALFAAPGGVLYMGTQTQNEMEELKRIELAGRTCYKSEDKMTNDSSIAFFDKLCRHKHYAMLRFGERTLVLGDDLWDDLKSILIEYNQLQYWRYVDNGHYTIQVSANLQCWIFLVKAALHAGEFVLASSIWEMFRDWPIVLSAMTPEDVEERWAPEQPTDFIDIDADEISPALRRHVFRVVTDRGITHEIVRHTTLSYAQESTRYVSYNGAGFKVFVPSHLQAATDMFEKHLTNCAAVYSDALAHSGIIPGDARNLLPHCLKTEIVISGYMDYGPTDDFNQGFSHFLAMRDDKAAHKGIQQVAKEMRKHLPARD